jgi:hypothetical protein
MYHKFSVTFLAVLFLLGTIAAQSSIAPINGWTLQAKEDGAILQPPNENYTEIPFTYTILKTITSNDTSANWLEEVIKADKKQQGYTETGTPNQKLVGRITYYTTTIKDTQGQKMYMYYMAYRHSQTKIRLARVVSLSRAELEDYFQTVTKHFTSLGIKEGMNKTQ